MPICFATSACSSSPPISNAVEKSRTVSSSASQAVSDPMTSSLTNRIASRQLPDLASPTSSALTILVVGPTPW